ncbi:MAG: GNAT family N-acetyltransferase [Alphaproteobacteria bacterium]|nr:MAG: GNAT family N-acetyltransferase [Alphaproteobacteria bacterium]TAF13847.1 MAG: GNAT family N-acetyltransferase [Alphaproteobacteria bacterium]TAF41290.1 MAG: GNAT family N-acetyltransferase [Alphaproteobacteria bacterium]TAF76275.1 MAG: GNAT family N-acetyltransferase [Alphaproteobacteria bacterium]
MELVIKHGDVHDPLYQECLELRYEVLRKPLGLEITDEEREADMDAVHVIAYVDGQVAGTVALCRERLRQMAVLERFQGRGIGAQLVRYLEAIAKERGQHALGLDARCSAIPFYEKLGYHCCSDMYEKIGILHRNMIKALYYGA